jgi:hypothetical protein
MIEQEAARYVMIHKYNRYRPNRENEDVLTENYVLLHRETGRGSDIEGRPELFAASAGK